MKQNRQQLIWWVALCLTAVAVAFIMLPSLILEPGSIILQLGGDGFKNYFTYFWQSMYGKGIWFDGMNYPYGEHIVYTDGQPFLSVPLSYLRDTLHLTRASIIAILHYTIVINYILSVVVVGMILRRFNVLPYLSILFAALIILLSPQLFRIFGHFGLCYFSVIPLLFYWTIRFKDTHRLRYVVYIFLMGAIAGFAHPYFVAVIFIWGMMYAIAYFMATKAAVKEKVLHVLPMLVSVVAIFVWLKVIMLATDPIKDRPVEPYGTLSACTTGSDIVMSSYSPIWSGLGEVSGLDLPVAGEGYTYLGIAVIVIALISLLSLVAAKIRKRQPEHSVVDERQFSPIWLLMAVGILLLSMGVPFVWGMEWLLDYLSAFRQFRSLGRFSWMFYYIIAVYAIVVFNGWYVRKLAQKKAALAISILGLVMAVWIWEIAGYTREAHSHQGKNGNFCYEWAFSTKDTTWNDYLQQQGFTSNDFQAIMLYPYIHIGTEKVWLAGDKQWTFTLGGRAAMQLHLPMVNVMMSRSSWSQAFSQLKLIGGAMTDKSYLDAVNEKPFLLLYWYEHTAISRDAKYLFEASDSIGTFSGTQVFACYPSRIREAYQKAYDRYLSVYETLQSTDTLIEGSGEYFIAHLDTGSYDKPLMGAGALSVFKDEHTVLTEFHLKASRDTASTYEFSAWVLHSDENYAGAEFMIESFDSSYGLIQTDNAYAAQTTDFNGMWFRVATYLDILPNAKHIRITVRNDPNPAYIALDEVLLRPLGATVISKDKNGKGMVNGHLLYK